MRTRALLLSITSLAAVLPSAALATDSPAPAPLQPAPSLVSLQSVLGKCSDTTKPTSGFGATAAAAARKSKILRGTAGDRGCGVAMVTVSILRVHGKGCQPLMSSGKVGHTGSCSARRFVVANGTSQWRLKLPKRLPKGTYLVRTRAIDFAGNVQQVRTRRVKLG
jgi:uncharacterized low-complexity protein